MPITSELYVSAPGVDIPKGGTLNKAKVLAQYVPESYTDSMCEGTDCNAGMSDVAILILDKELSNKSFRYATKEEILLMKSVATTVLAIGYGLKSEQDWQNAKSGIGQDGKPTKSEAVTRTNFCCAGKKVEQWSKDNPYGLVQTVLPRGVFHGGGDSGSPLWIKIGTEWVYVGAAGAAQGPVAGNVEATSPRWTDPFELSVVGATYFTIAGHQNIFSDAEKYLSQRILFEQKPVVVVTPTPTPTPIPVAKQEVVATEVVKQKPILQSAQKRVKIVCIKGKYQRTVYGYNPVCPKGWSKK